MVSEMFQKGGCGEGERGCAAYVRQAMKNRDSDVKEVRQAANAVIHCECMDAGCKKYKKFVDVAKKHGVL